MDVPLFTLDVAGLTAWFQESEDRLEELWSDDPGRTIESTVYAARDFIDGPTDTTIDIDVLVFDSDPTMVLVRIRVPGELCFTTYAVDWDDIAPRDMLMREPTIDEAVEIVTTVVESANRTMGLVLEYIVGFVGAAADDLATGSA